jgi:hypothetical protein
MGFDFLIICVLLSFALMRSFPRRQWISVELQLREVWFPPQRQQGRARAEVSPRFSLGLRRNDDSL